MARAARELHARVLPSLVRRIEALYPPLTQTYARAQRPDDRGGEDGDQAGGDDDDERQEAGDLNLNLGMDFPRDGQQLARVLHAQGVNLRYLGRVFALASLPALRTLCT